MGVDTVGVEQARRTGLKPPLSQWAGFSAVYEAAYLLGCVWESRNVHAQAWVQAVLDESRLAAAVAAPFGRKRQRDSGWKELTPPHRVTVRPAVKVSP
jgi:hypothetical protein